MNLEAGLRDFGEYAIIGQNSYFDQFRPTMSALNDSGQIFFAKPVVLRLSPLGFHRYAVEFLDVAKSVEKKPEFSPVPYFLYCHALELVLKAFLLAKNIPLMRTHNLRPLLNGAKQQGLETLVKITPEQEAEIDKANAYYKPPQKGFEYFRVTRAATGYPDLPDIRILEELTSTLICELESLCLNAAQPSL